MRRPDSSKRSFSGRSSLGYYMLFALAIPLSALFTNCQKSPDAEPPANRTPQSQSGGTNPVNEDDQIVHTFTANGKVQIKQKSLIQAPQLLAKIRAAGRMFKSSGDQLAVASGTNLLVVLDRLCPLPSQGFGVSTLGATSTRVLSDLRIQAFNVTLKEAKLIAELSDEAESDTCVLSVENNEHVSVGPVNTEAIASSLVVPNDPSFAQLTHLNSIEAPAAWDTFFSPGRGLTKTVLVGIVDTGIDYTHPDLVANVWSANDGTHGMDVFNGDTNPMDDNGHGTHVAGLIGAAANNGVGVTGVMGKNIKLMAVKALGSDGSADISDLINGIRWAADHGAEVINLSVGAAGTSTAFKDALTYASSKNVVMAVAAGNDGHEITTSVFTSPAGYCVTTPGTIAVGSYDTNNRSVSSFSNYSTTYVAIAAPGSENSAAYTGLLSTYPNNKYARLEGTSMATPIVTGSAALIVGAMKSNGISVVNTTVVTLLKSSATVNAAAASKISGGAQLNLERLARAVRYRYMIDSDAGTEAIQ